MMKYLVMEIQTQANGTVGNFVWAFDTQDEAYSKYFSVLSVAAVSALPMHSAVMIGNDGNLYAQQCFVHETKGEN